VVLPDDHAQFHSKLEANQTTFRVKVIFDDQDKQTWDSLAHLWSRWYRAYLEAPYPRLLIRFEDLLFHSEKIMQLIGKCVDAKVNPDHYVQTSSSKSHGSGTDFTKAIIKTGDAKARLQMLTVEDLRFAAEYLDPELMSMFRYNTPQTASVR
jgi:hypothetical protein